MKKIYLLSAVACMFAFAANAQEEAKPTEWTFEENVTKDALQCDQWFVSGAFAKQPTLVEAEVSGVTQKVKIKNVAQVLVADTGDPWSTQFCYVMNKESEGFATGKDFKLEFDAYWTGPFADTVELCVLSGKLLDDREGSRTHDDWQWGDNKELDPAGQWWQGGFLNQPYNLAKEEWTHIVWAEGSKLGDAGWLGLQINLGTKNAEKNSTGKFLFANVVFTLGENELAFFNEAEVPSAIADAAAIKAFVANDVLYASEAADVVIYSVNGVAVKSVKGATSVNVSDLKAGLYIAKVGNATVKFVK